MQYRFFTNSKKAWTNMYQAISSAQSSVFFEMYIFEDNTVGFDFVNLLAEKAKSGVKVKILLDSFGSFDLPNERVAVLREAGAEVLFFSRFLHRVHRKILVVDNKVAFTGGMNVNRGATDWRDIVVVMKGFMVSRLVKLFAKDYESAGGKDPLVLSYRKRKFIHNAKSWLIEHSPIRKRFDMSKAYRKYINEAEQEIIIVTPYFAPKRWFMALLEQAALRGVRVEIVVPEKTEDTLLDKCNYFYMSRLNHPGIKFLLEPFMNHAKVLLIDGKLGLIGSQNMDFLSSELNAEVGVFITDQSAIHRLYSIVNIWKKDVILFEPKNYRLSWWDRILANFLNFFEKMI